MNTKKIMKSVLSIVLLSVAGGAFAQADSLAVVTEVAPESGSVMETVKEILLAILLLGGALFIIGHMVYVLYKTFKFQDHYSATAFKTARQAAGLTPESSSEENQTCRDLLATAYETWTHIETDDEGTEYRRPNKMKEIVKSHKILEQVVQIQPTDSEIVEILNSYASVVCDNQKRKFDGSWKLIIVGLLISMLMGLILKTNDVGFFLATLKYGSFFYVPVIIYYISSLTPKFLIEKRAARGGGNMSSGLVAIALGILGSGYTVTTHYTDGTKEVDNSGHFMALMLGVIVLLIIAFTIIFWALLNYIRNYVLYF